MKRLTRKILSAMMIVLFITGLFFPIEAVFAAPNITFNPTFQYNQQTSRWQISWLPVDGTDSVSVIWHNPDGSVTTEADLPLVLASGKNTISLDLGPDHIYDLSFSFKNRDGNPVSFRNKYNVQVSQDMIFFLADMSFEGTSFNDMAILGGLTDGSPNLVMSADGTQVIRIKSGQEPKITLRWKVPTIWEPSAGRILAITSRDVDLNRLESGATPHVDIDYSYFHVKMNVVKDIVTTKDYRTVYGSGGVIVRETGETVSGLNANGEVTSSDGYVSYTLDQTDGIIPGTEYEKINIRPYFWNNAEDEQAISSRLVYGFSSGQGFPIENKDNIFQTIEGRIDSLFTPMMYEVSKVDVDKMEIRIYKIKSRNYTELYYQVQDAGTVVELLESATDTGTGIKVPDASIPGSTGWGSVIVEIPLDQNGRHPEHYYRVVVTDGNSHTPLGSLAVDLRMLGNDTGKPPVPREIKVTTEYALKQNVTYGNNQAAGETVRIPSTNLRISFEKPLLWMTREWGDIQSAPDEDNDFTFHFLLNTYLSDNVKIMETRVIGDQKVTVFVPVKEKRVLTVDKHDLYEDPNDSSRLVYELDGTGLFMDHAAETSLAFENNVDTDINGRADYPTFLLPNTLYYLRMFSTRRKDSGTVNWAANTGLGEKISYISPVVSFTTYPSRDLPVPMPNLVLGTDVEAEPDPVTGKPIFNGITVDFPKILDDNDWLEYTQVTDNRKIVYDLYISSSTNENSFVLLQPPHMETLQTVYPDENPNSGISSLVTRFPAGSGQALKPNTTYYFKMQAKLFVSNETDPFLVSDFTPIKSITTPKTDSGSMDDLERKPRTPVEFAIAVKDGRQELTDARVTLNWLNAEQDVVYEMVCTREMLHEDYDYTLDDYHIGDTQAPGFLDVYRNYKPAAADDELVINVLNTPLKEVGFTYNEGYTRVARFPVNLPYLKPNHLYYFSLRAVRNRGQENASYSDWVSIPVTTKMVTPPDFIEPVNDVQLGFKVTITGNVREEDLKILLKKTYEVGSSYQEQSRAKYSVVRDGRDYYVRLYDLEPDTWYDIQPYYSQGNTKRWYDSRYKTWDASPASPVKLKTRNTLNEIEVRFAGEELYDYFLEIRTDDDEDYMTLEYTQDQSGSDYGYQLADGTRVDFYREKLAAYVTQGLNDKYMYYAKISSVRRKKSDGTYDRRALLANTRYYVKAWAFHVAESNRIGPVTIRTDFSQEDYDQERIRDEINDLFKSRADGLTGKLYFTADEPDKTANRVLLKGSLISGMLKVAGYSGVTVDISAEKPESTQDIILIPMEILTTLQTINNRLTIRLSGGELTLTGETISLDALKKAAAANGVKETMLELAVERKQSGSAEPPKGFTMGSTVFEISMRAVGMKRTYAEINTVIYSILKQPNTSGPFKYGIMDRELIQLMEDRTTLTYKSQVELDGLIELRMERIEEELSLYIRDILEGGRGYTASRVSRRELGELAGGMKLKMLHNTSQSLAQPMVLPKGAAAWQDPAGVKAWLFPYVLVNCKIPGQYAVFTSTPVTIAATNANGTVNPELQRLSLKYDLQKVFGKTLYPGDFVSKDSAVALFEVVTETTDETMGMSVPAKIKYYQLEKLLPASGLKTNVNRQQATSLVVEIYAWKSGVSAEALRPTTNRFIKNSAAIPDPIYHRLVIALDLGLTSLEPDRSYKGEGFATIEELLREIITVLDLLGEW